MALDFTNGGPGTGRLGRTTNVPVTGPPCTMAGWAYLSTLGGTGLDVLCLTDNAAAPPGTGYYFLALYDLSGSLQTYSYVTNGVLNSQILAAGPAEAVGWYHVCVVHTSTSSHAAFINGGGKTTDATAVNPTTIAQTVIGHAGMLGCPGSLAWPGESVPLGVFSASVTSALRSTGPPQRRPQSR